MITVVVIGRNESKNIVRTARSILFMKKEVRIPVQTIYVDSASSDGTADIARQYFDEIYVLEESKYLCAAAGRFIGTKKAKYDWILYMDADMEICPEFINDIEKLISCNTENISGYIGNYIFVFDNGNISKVTFGDKNMSGSNSIGGCVLLKTKAVKSVGNWNPSVFSFEERELYSRLGKGKKNIMYIDVQMIKHHTDYISRWQLLSQLFFPGKGLGKKYFGFGQMVAASIRNNSFFYVLRNWPEPFIYLGSLMIGILLLLTGYYIVAVMQLSIMLIYLSFKTRRTNLFLFLSLLPRLMLGLPKYNGNYRPVITNVAKTKC